MKTDSVRFDDELIVSNDPEVQEALERMCVETMATYRLAATCWLWVRDVTIVRLVVNAAIDLDARHHAARIIANALLLEKPIIREG